MSAPAGVPLTIIPLADSAFLVEIGADPVISPERTGVVTTRAARLLAAGVGFEPPVKAALVLLTGTLIPDVTIKGGGPTDVAILDRTDIPGCFRRGR